MTYFAKIIAGGKIVIPAQLRRDLGISDGDSVAITRSPDGVLSIRTHDQVVAEGQHKYRQMLKSPFTVDDFVADRRRDAESD